MTVTPSSIEQVIPGQGAMAQPSSAPSSKRARRNRFRFISNGKAATGLVILAIYVLFAVIGPWVAPYSVRGTHEKVSVLFGGRVWTRLVVPVSRVVSVSAHVGLDVAANDVQILRGESQVVFSSPRVGVAGGLGVTVDIDR